MAKLNIKQFKTELNRPLRRVAAPFMLRAAQVKVDAHKRQLLEQFDENEAVKELKEGEQASSTIIGGGGNLFSFIGFDVGTDPTKPVRDMLEREVELETIPVVVERPESITYRYTIRVPTEEDIADVTPTPRIPGRSWALDLEKGVLTGIGQYVYHLFFDPKYSHSTTGLQDKRRADTGRTVSKTPFLRDLLKKFRDKFF